MLKELLALSLILTSGFACAQSSKAPELPAIENPTPIDPARVSLDQSAALIQSGIPESFVRELEKRYTRKKKWFQDALKLVEPNVFGFMYQGDYLKHDSAGARKKTSRYLLAHQNSFKAAEKRYQVSSESIAALLWVETKLGKSLGNHPIPFVFYSIALSGQPSVCQEMQKLTEGKLAKSKTPEKPDLQTAQKKLQERCKQKSEWAIEELKVLARLEESKKLDVFGLRGSFAGAFGLAQFLPSSYEKYAVSDYRKRPDLFLISDAILSIGNFLKQNGWKADSTESQTLALYAYNRSRDYGQVILKIAEAL